MEPGGVERAVRRLQGSLDRLAWALARGAVDAVRYQPRQLDLVMACAASQPEVPAPLARWVASARSRPVVVEATEFPHTAVSAMARAAARWFGPTGSAIVRWCSGAVANAADRLGALTLEQPLRGRAHPGLLVPHPHAVAVVAIDMRGFSNLTRVLSDTQYLADCIGEYLSELTQVVEHHRGVIFQYTGDGLLALFLPELAGVKGSTMVERLVDVVGPELHRAFDALYERWRTEWQASGRVGTEIGLGVGMSFGQATIGYIGPSGKKQFGVIGEPVNVAAFLCSQAFAGTVLVDQGSFARAGATLPVAKVIRLRSKKRHQRIETVVLSYGTTNSDQRASWLPSAFRIG